MFQFYQFCNYCKPFNEETQGEEDGEERPPASARVEMVRTSGKPLVEQWLAQRPWAMGTQAQHDESTTIEKSRSYKSLRKVKAIRADRFPFRDRMTKGRAEEEPLIEEEESSDAEAMRCFDDEIAPEKRAQDMLAAEAVTRAAEQQIAALQIAEEARLASEAAARATRERLFLERRSAEESLAAEFAARATREFIAAEQSPTKQDFAAAEQRVAKQVRAAVDKRAEEERLAAEIATKAKEELMAAEKRDIVVLRVRKDLNALVEKLSAESKEEEGEEDEHVAADRSTEEENLVVHAELRARERVMAGTGTAGDGLVVAAHSKQPAFNNLDPDTARTEEEPSRPAEEEGVAVAAAANADKKQIAVEKRTEEKRVAAIPIAKPAVEQLPVAKKIEEDVSLAVGDAQFAKGERLLATAAEGVVAQAAVREAGEQARPAAAAAARADEELVAAAQKRQGSEEEWRQWSRQKKTDAKSCPEPVTAEKKPQGETPRAKPLAAVAQHKRKACPEGPEPFTATRQTHGETPRAKPLAAVAPHERMEEHLSLEFSEIAAQATQTAMADFVVDTSDMDMLDYTLGG